MRKDTLIDTLIKPPRVIYSGMVPARPLAQGDGRRDKVVSERIGLRAWARETVRVFGEITVLLLLAVAPSAAQTVRCTVIEKQVQCTAQKLDPKAALTVLTNSKLESNVTLVRFGVSELVPKSASAGSSGPTPGPWDFPPERPARRLDGTLLSDPVTTYGPPIVWIPVPLYPAR